MYYSNRGIRSTNESALAIVDFKPAVITGLRVEEVDKGVSYEDGVSIVLAGATVSVILWLLRTCQLSHKRIIDQTNNPTRLILPVHNNLFFS